MLAAGSAFFKTLFEGGFHDSNAAVATLTGSEPASARAATMFYSKPKARLS